MRQARILPRWPHFCTTCDASSVIHVAAASSKGSTCRISVRTVISTVGTLYEIRRARYYGIGFADVAQLVEQSIRNRQVIGSSPIVGSRRFPQGAPARSAFFFARCHPVHGVVRSSMAREDSDFPCHVLPADAHKRKGRPATGRPFLQGRIVPTEARPSKLSAQIL